MRRACGRVGSGRIYLFISWIRYYLVLSLREPRWNLETVCICWKQLYPVNGVRRPLLQPSSVGELVMEACKFSLVHSRVVYGGCVWFAISTWTMFRVSRTTPVNVWDDLWDCNRSEVYPSPSRRRRTVPLRHQPRHHCCGAQTTDVNKIVGKQASGRASEPADGQRPTDEQRRHRSISIYRRSNVDECFPTGHHGRRAGGSGVDRRHWLHYGNRRQRPQRGREVTGELTAKCFADQRRSASRHVVQLTQAALGAL